MIRLLMKGLPESKVDDLTLMNGMSLGYQRCQYGTGYIAFLMAFAIGVYRRFVFNDVDAILWNEQEDNRMVWKVMLAVLGSSLLSDVWYNIQVSNGDVDFDMVAHKVKGKTVKEDPLGDDTYRNIPYRFYPFSFMASAFVIWSLYLTYLGPHFVFGICRETQFTGEDAEFSLWCAQPEPITFPPQPLTLRPLPPLYSLRSQEGQQDRQLHRALAVHPVQRDPVRRQRDGRRLGVEQRPRAPRPVQGVQA
jgi:hypothetical protein